METKKIVVRIPPSPTGFFHIGRARTALFNFLYAKKYGGQIVFRLEDTDKERSKEEYAQDIIECLKWVGITYDEGPIRQSERTDIYTSFIQKMLDENKAYISQETEGLNKEVIRFRNPNKKIVFKDELRGEIVFDTTELGDFVIARNLKDPLYHLTVVVDDFLMNVTHIIRGDDGISNTPRQILIQEAIGAPLPTYVHIPLILAPDRSKMSGRHGAVSLRDYRDAGYLPEAIVNYLALLGWNSGTTQEIWSLDELIQAFNLKGIQKGGAIFDRVKLDWINKEWIRKIPKEEFEKKVATYFPDYDQKIIQKISPIIQERVSTFKEIENAQKNGEFDFVFGLPAFDKDMLLCPERMRKDKDVTKEIVTKHMDVLIDKIKNISVENFNAATVKDAVWDYASAEGRGIVLWAMRVALSGRENSPDPFSISDIIGKDETINRLTRAK